MRLPALSIIAALIALPAAASTPVTLDQAMAHPDWIGTPAESAWWSWDGKQVFFKQKRVGSPLRDTYQAVAGKPRLVGDAELSKLDSANVVYNLVGQFSHALDVRVQPALCVHRHRSHALEIDVDIVGDQRLRVDLADALRIELYAFFLAGDADATRAPVADVEPVAADIIEQRLAGAVGCKLAELGHGDDDARIAIHRGNALLVLAHTHAQFSADDLGHDFPDKFFITAHGQRVSLAGLDLDADRTFSAS
jgi:hypothetical protein